MSSVWSFIAKYAVKVALWVLHNPAQVDAAATEVHALVDTLKSDVSAATK